MEYPALVEGYAVVYLTQTGSVVCATHATSECAQHPFWEGSPVECEHDGCGVQIESSYGEV